MEGGNFCLTINLFESKIKFPNKITFCPFFAWEPSQDLVRISR